METKLGTSMYHLTIDWDEPNISFIQSPSCHIPSMNVRTQDIKYRVFIEIQPPPPLVYRDLGKTGQGITKPKTSLDALEFLHHYLEEFPCLHPLFEGYPKIIPPPPPTLGNFP